MSDLDRYLQAATRPNTRKSYESATRHFEREFGGFLPATPDSVARYLAHYAGRLSINTLRLRLAALGQWHDDHGFPDPTSASVVRQALKGIQALHPETEKRATPLHLRELTHVVDWLESAIDAADRLGDAPTRHRRDRAFVLLGFWRGFRGDALTNLQVENVQIVSGKGMTCTVRSKTDHGRTGSTFRVPALSRWCPVRATAEWIEAAGLTEGPLFRNVNQWGQVAETPLHPNSIIRMLRTLFSAAGLPTPEEYSSHSLRRGFASWANANGWDLKSLMEYVGWKDIHSAMRYIDTDRDWVKDRMEMSVAAVHEAKPKALPAPTPAVERPK